MDLVELYRLAQDTLSRRRSSMLRYELVETNDGLTVIEVPPGMTCEDAAQQQNAQLIDPGPFTNYEEAYEALMALKPDAEEDFD
jgi:hypothetical protein